MVDVIHFLFEEDSTYSSAEQAESRSDMRTNLYKNLYGRPYRYIHPNSKKKFDNTYGAYEAPDDFEDLAPVNPIKKSSKPFVPATPVSENPVKPFGNILDAPLG